MNIPVMKLVVCRSLILGLITAFVSFPAHAAPSLSITKPPVVSGPNPNTGPVPQDPLATKGQWFFFSSPTSDLVGLESRTYQFHDNALGAGGGSASTKAIYGYVSSVISTSTSGTITGFDITATITNDNTRAPGASVAGRNSHGESLVSATGTPSYVGPLVAPILTANFALSLPTLFPPVSSTGTPYVPSPGARIVATNSSERAWYCFNNITPSGNFYVPCWRFPTINPGASATVVLQFQVLDGGLPSSDPRYAAIKQSYSTHADILSSRTASLKISRWVDGLWLDTGATSFSNSSSDVAVFHDIVPTP